ncbi:TonB-dependent receptor domain-containing protein [candidate division CSSED10-310 bacterium]|uniref:TonB-dependent receptor domain-containing protein n=1 Tax=candidate division CSSED10-310 bacterium TaxID=2855610 RepID=A0ABV6YVC4_UNCC1
MRYSVFYLSLLSFLLVSNIRANDTNPLPQAENTLAKPVGILSGIVLDRDTEFPLSGTRIELSGPTGETSTDAQGRFTIRDIPVGAYILTVSFAGFETLTKTDIIIKSGRTTSVRVALKMIYVETDEVTVLGGYFTQSEDQPVSTTTFSREEIRRSSGSAGDVSRIIGILPSIAKLNDQVNSLVVRGGSPYENAFYIDDMEVPNINHYPSFGSTGGPIGIINVDFIEDVSFSAGGFSARYGDRLSSVMDITFREGNREQFELQFDLNMAGFGALAEGPLSKGAGSWLLSIRRSYLDLLVEEMGLGVAPRYSDYQGKLTFEINSTNTVSFLAIVGNDYFAIDQVDSTENGNNNYGQTKVEISFAGLNWRRYWTSDGYSATTIAHSYTRHVDHWAETATGKHLYNDDSREQAFKLRNDNYLRINKTNRLRFGLEAKKIFNHYDYFRADYVDHFGNQVPELTVDTEIEGYKYGLFVSYIAEPHSKIETTFGVRYDHFTVTDNAHLSPRFSLSYKLFSETSLIGSMGIYYQNIPPSVLAQKTEFKELKDPVAYHYILGLSHLLTENTRLTLEFYAKEYDHFPLNPNQPETFPADEGADNVDELIASGQANSRGVEFLIQKKLVRDFYGLFSAAYFKSQYRDYNGVWRPRLYDNRLLFNVEAGYKPNQKWEFNLRWVYAGGRPYTPLDIEASEYFNSAVLDQTRFHQDRFPAYHSLNVRFDRRFDFKHSNLIVFIDFWNVYNRQNIAFYYWNEIEKKQDRIDQWSFLPILGLEWEF